MHSWPPADTFDSWLDLGERVAPWTAQTGIQQPWLLALSGFGLLLVLVFSLFSVAGRRIPAWLWLVPGLLLPALLPGVALSQADLVLPATARVMVPLIAMARALLLGTALSGASLFAGLLVVPRGEARDARPRLRRVRGVLALEIGVLAVLVVGWWTGDASLTLSLGLGLAVLGAGLGMSRVRQVDSMVPWASLGVVVALYGAAASVTLRVIRNEAAYPKSMELPWEYAEGLLLGLLIGAVATTAMALLLARRWRGGRAALLGLVLVSTGGMVGATVRAAARASAVEAVPAERLPIVEVSHHTLKGPIRVPDALATVWTDEGWVDRDRFSGGVLGLDDTSERALVVPGDAPATVLFRRWTTTTRPLAFVVQERERPIPARSASRVSSLPIRTCGREGCGGGRGQLGLGLLGLEELRQLETVQGVVAFCSMRPACLLAVGDAPPATSRLPSDTGAP